MGKLHEVLAVEKDLKITADHIQDETAKLFQSKHEHFDGIARVYTPLIDKDEELPSENKEIVTTVPERLAYTDAKLIRLFDCLYQKEQTNTYAAADLEIDGVVIAEKVPATFLLNMESRLEKYKNVLTKIPTLEFKKFFCATTQ